MTALNTATTFPDAEQQFLAANGCDGVQQVELRNAEGVLRSWNRAGVVA